MFHAYGQVLGCWMRPPVLRLRGFVDWLCERGKVYVV